VKLAILTQYYPPEIGAPQARLSALAHAFARRGHTVTVLTAMPSYPAGKLQPGYGGAFRHERHDGVRVIRTLVYPTQDPGLIRRLASYLSFTLSSAIVGAAALAPADYLLVESPPLLLGLTGMWLSRLKRARLVFNVSDLWPESAVRLGVVRAGGAAHRLGGWLEALCYRHAWLVTGQSTGIVRDIADRFPKTPTFHLSNAVDTAVFHPDRSTAAARALLHSQPGAGRCVALYAGLHGLAQGLAQLLDAAASLPPQCDLDVVLMGDGPEKARLMTQARERGLRRLRFLDARPHEDMPALLATADIVIVPLLRDLPGAVPSKLYEAMAAARPVVLVAEGEPARIVTEHRAGLVIRPQDAAGLAQALATLAGDPTLRRTLGQNGRAAAVALFDRATIADRFIEFLECRRAS